MISMHMYQHASHKCILPVSRLLSDPPAIPNEGLFKMEYSVPYSTWQSKGPSLQCMQAADMPTTSDGAKSMVTGYSCLIMNLNAYKSQTSVRSFTVSALLLSMVSMNCIFIHTLNLPPHLIGDWKENCCILLLNSVATPVKLQQEEI